MKKSAPGSSAGDFIPDAHGEKPGAAGGSQGIGGILEHHAFRRDRAEMLRAVQKTAGLSFPCPTSVQETRYST